MIQVKNALIVDDRFYLLSKIFPNQKKTPLRSVIYKVLERLLLSETQIYLKSQYLVN